MELSSTSVIFIIPMRFAVYNLVQITNYYEVLGNALGIIYQVILDSIDTARCLRDLIEGTAEGVNLNA